MYIHFARSGLVFMSLCIYMTLLGAQGLYKWVDANGKVHYSDAPPLEKQKKGVAEVSKQGIVTYKAQTEADQRVNGQSEAKTQEQLKEQERQNRRDNVMLESYSSVIDLKNELARQRSILRGALEALYIRTKGLDRELTVLRAEIQQISANQQVVPTAKFDQIRTLAEELRAVRATITQKEKALQDFDQHAEKTIQRYVQVRATK